MNVQQIFGLHPGKIFSPLEKFRHLPGSSEERSVNCSIVVSVPCLQPMQTQGQMLLADGADLKG